MTTGPSSHQPSPHTDNGGRPRRYDVEPWRKWAYYGGMAVSAIGYLMFFYVFFGFFQIISGGPEGLSTGVPRGFRIFPIAVVGILLAAAGGQLRRIGRKGLAGAGIVLSPQGETADAEPWDRSEGQRLQHRLEEVPGLRGVAAGAAAPAAPQVRIRCRSCGYLESEDATFCSSCGRPV